eukprot:1114929-Pelagomonas_calceolata.AAC.2
MLCECKDAKIGLLLAACVIHTRCGGGPCASGTVVEVQQAGCAALPWKKNRLISGSGPGVCVLRGEGKKRHSTWEFGVACPLWSSAPFPIREARFLLAKQASHRGGIQAQKSSTLGMSMSSASMTATEEVGQEQQHEHEYRRHDGHWEGKFRSEMPGRREGFLWGWVKRVEHSVEEAQERLFGLL